jgi:tetraprenyl-beta-curcumene synthase
MASPRLLAALLYTATVHWAKLRPIAKREITHWLCRAQAIPDGQLRELAVEKLTGEALNPEGAAFFATLASQRIVRLIVAFQVVYDYLDAVTEQPEYATLKASMRLHGALLDAVGRQGNHAYYERDDLGYIDTLVDCCRGLCASSPVLIRAARRVGEAQTLNHLIPTHGVRPLQRWSEANNPGGYLWWETAAAGISCLSIHALFAAGTEQGYWAPVCAISALLDSLIDYTQDTGTTNHSFVAHYTGQAANRFAAIIHDALEQLHGLPHSDRHRVILAGVVGFYLGAPNTDPAVRASALQAAGWPARATVWAMRCFLLGLRRPDPQTDQDEGAEPDEPAVSTGEAEMEQSISWGAQGQIESEPGAGEGGRGADERDLRADLSPTTRRLYEGPGSCRSCFSGSPSRRSSRATASSRGPSISAAARTCASLSRNAPANPCSIKLGGTPQTAAIAMRSPFLGSSFPASRRLMV